MIIIKIKGKTNQPFILGLNVTASSSLWVVREMYNGRKVKYGYFIAKPILTIGNKMFILIATRLMKFS